MSEDHDLLLTMSIKLDQIHDEVVGTEANPGLKAKVDDLESWRDKSKGWVAGFVAALTALASAFGYHIIHK